MYRSPGSALAKCTLLVFVVALPLSAQRTAEQRYSGWAAPGFPADEISARPQGRENLTGQVARSPEGLEALMRKGRPIARRH